MDDWQIDMMRTINQTSISEAQVLQCLECAASLLGFDYVCYGFRPNLPLNNARFTWLSNYPSSWKQRHAQEHDLDIDPVVVRACHSQCPVLWDDELFADNPVLWQEAQRHGLRYGWSQSVLDEPAGISVLSLARTEPAITVEELSTKQCRMRWLAQTAHQVLSRIMRQRQAENVPNLTEREIEVLKWTADGKSAQDIADILTLSKRTVDFHIKNSVSKLNTPNKTAAVVRAVLLGLFRQP
ncbi:MAG: autoinducer binding domain-containing protein [Lautropia sp.]|nr:autoinducer binding domain-containing protein [Lautropia sp.]